MQRMTRLASALLVAVLCSPCHGQDTASVEKIWRERQERIKEIHLKWVERSTHHTRPGETAEGQGEMALSANGRIRLLSDNFPQSTPGPNSPPSSINPATAKVVLSRQVKVYDGVAYAGLYSPEPRRPYHVVGRGSGVIPNWGFVANISALEMFCRPFDKKPNAIPGGLAGFQSRLEELDGVKVVVLEKGEKTFWVTNDDRALMLKRLSKRMEGVPSSEVRARYAKDSVSGEWLPAGWDYRRFGADGKFLVESRTAEVTEAYVHTPLPVELFRMDEIPEGAFVQDERDGKVTEYIHRSKKGPRYLRPGEFIGENYTDLLYSESPDRPTPRSTK